MLKYMLSVQQKLFYGCFFFIKGTPQVIDRKYAHYQYSRAKSLAQKDCMEEQQNISKGKYETEFDNYIKHQMKVQSEKHFDGDAMVGNVEQKFHEEILSGNCGFLHCLNYRPAIQKIQNHMEHFVQS